MNAGGRLGIGVIGAGRVGPVLASALAGAGHAVTAVTVGSDPDRVSAMLPDVPQVDAVEVARRSELVIIAVPHEELPELISGLAAVGAWQMGQLVLHTDPGYGVDVFAPARSAGVIPLAVHPAIVFTGTSMDLRRLTGAYAAVTAPGPVLPIAQALAVEMGCEPVVVAEEDRPAYAEAIGTVTTLAAEVVRQSADLLRGIGVGNPGGYLEALAHSSIDSALTAAGRGEEMLAAGFLEDLDEDEREG